LKKYDIELLNEKDLTTATNFRATAEAWEAYKKMRPQLLIPISEIEPGKPVAVIYNFPQKYVRNGEIELAEPDKVEKAKFKLVQKISQPGQPAD
jgi:hypothetical protein